MSRLILAVDPGKTSGMCCFSYGGEQLEPKMLWSYEKSQAEYAEPIRELVARAALYGANLSVVCERFTINAQTVKNSQAPYSLEQIGVLKQILLDYKIDPETIKFQSPADAKRMFSNEALKKLEYWHVGGGGHALDAIRHALLYATKTGWTPRRLLQ